MLRRFRRAVRKLTLVRSIIDQLQSPSVLTQYNQYELHTNGIYDLVLTERIKHSNSTFLNDDRPQKLEISDSITNAEQRNLLFASNYIKINYLLNILSSSQQSLKTENNTTIETKNFMQIESYESMTSAKDNYDRRSVINSEAICCSAHRQSPSYFMFPSRQRISSQPSQLALAGSNSKRGSNSHLNKTSFTLSRQSTVCY